MGVLLDERIDRAEGRTDHSFRRGKLTDGVYATATTGHRRSVKWRDGNPTIVIDLQAPEEIAAVSAQVPGRVDGGRSVRGSLHVSTSLEGHDWQPVATVAGESLANDQSPRAM